MNEKILILSDNKPGHLNQSIAFCKLKNINYDIVVLNTSNKVYKIISYFLDYFSIYVNLFKIKLENDNYKAVISTGSFTYYANKFISKKLKIKSIAIMLPKGFRYDDFDYIIAQKHDSPQVRSNIITMPLNLSINEPMNLLPKRKEKSLGIIIGGNNKIFTMRIEDVKQSLDEIYNKFPNHLKYITTSPRTPKEIEIMLEEYVFDYKIIYSKNDQLNPIPDFIDVCDELYISIDSTSMLSEAKANSTASIHIINLHSKKENTKYHRLAENIENIKGTFDYFLYLDKVKL